MPRLLPHWAYAFLKFLPWRTRCRWLAAQLQNLQHHQDVFANAAYCVVSGHGPHTLEDAICSAESMQTLLSEVSVQLAMLAVDRAATSRA